MSRIICGIFDRSLDADAALEELKREGFRRSEVDAFYVSPPGQHAHDTGGRRRAALERGLAHRGHRRGPGRGDRRGGRRGRRLGRCPATSAWW